jgi:hypothetical protein
MPFRHNGKTVSVPIGIARATNGDVTPAGEKFPEILRKDLDVALLDTDSGN